MLNKRAGLKQSALFCLKTMEVKVKRKISKEDFTIGNLYIDGVFECYTLEDEKREVKVMHETRIPAGKYEIKLRTFGGHHEKYSKKFPDVHKGMLWLQEVPKFRDILIHIGNTDDDTSGCILVGGQIDAEAGKVFYSTKAYLKLYPKIASEIAKGNKVFITVED